MKINKSIKVSIMGHPQIDNYGTSGDVAWYAPAEYEGPYGVECVTAVWVPDMDTTEAQSEEEMDDATDWEKPTEIHGISPDELLSVELMWMA